VWIYQGDCLCPCSYRHFYSQVPWVLGLIVNGNHFQPEWPVPEPTAFLMRKESNRNIISFHANLKIWITEIKVWMYWSGVSI
jgi:hypothetical protein